MSAIKHIQHFTTDYELGKGNSTPTLDVSVSAIIDLMFIQSGCSDTSGKLPSLSIRPVVNF